MTNSTKQLKYRPLRGYKYQTLVDMHVTVPWLEGRDIDTANGLVQVTSGGTLTVRAAYAYDGASGPTRDDKTNMRASLFHDALYQMLRDGILPQRLRPQIDDLFLAMLKEDGMSRIRLNYYRLIKRVGGLTSKPQDPAPPLTAP